METYIAGGGCCIRNGGLNCSKLTKRCSNGYLHTDGKCYPYCIDIGYGDGWTDGIYKPYPGSIFAESGPACKNLTSQKAYYEIAVSVDFDLNFDTSKTRLENVLFDNVNLVYFATIVFTINFAPPTGEQNSIGFWTGSKVINCHQTLDTVSGVNSPTKAGWFRLTPGTFLCKQRIMMQIYRATSGIPPCIPYGQTTTPVPMNISIPTCGTLPPNTKKPGVYPNCNLPPSYVVPGLQNCTYAPLNYTTPPPLIQSEECKPFSLTIDSESASVEATKAFGADYGLNVTKSINKSLVGASENVNEAIIGSLNSAGLTVMC